jgi:hypothetical protein
MSTEVKLCHRSRYFLYLCAFNAWDSLNEGIVIRDSGLPRNSGHLEKGGACSPRRWSTWAEATIVYPGVQARGGETGDRERASDGPGARDLDIPSNLLRHWKQQIAEDLVASFPGKGRHKPHEKELARLKLELARVTQEWDCLKKCGGYFAKAPP